MSDLENFNPVESSESSWNTSPEVSEKFKEAAKKSSAGVQRTQKDEKKAQRYDTLLSHMLILIIRNKDFDDLLNPLFDCVDAWYPSNFIVWVFSLVYHPVHLKIREISKKPEFLFHYKIKEQVDFFHDTFVDPQIKNRINVWIEDIIDAVIVEVSSLTTERLKQLLQDDETILIFISLIFQFFLKKLNLEISIEKSQSYAKFISSEIQKSLKNIALEEI